MTGDLRFNTSSAVRTSFSTVAPFIAGSITTRATTHALSWPNERHHQLRNGHNAGLGDNHLSDPATQGCGHLAPDEDVTIARSELEGDKAEQNPNHDRSDSV
jgi:hypothetical protein